MNTAHEALKLAIAQLDVLYLGVPDMPEHERIIHAAVMEKLRAVIAASPAPPAQAAGMVLPPLNQDLIDILGRPNFQCIRIAQLFRQAGAEIATKAENEQAAVIHFMLLMYLQHGKHWATAADEHLKALVQQVKDKALAAREGGE